MMEIRARILQRSVFIAEEEIQVEVLITNHGSNTPGSRNLSNCRTPHDFKVHSSESWSKNKNIEIKNKSSTLAYGSAQITCHCDTNDRKIILPVLKFHRSQSEAMRNSTSFMPVSDSRGHCLYSTDASILFCDLKLKPGESKKFVYKETVAWDSPPSYKGQNIKFSYKILIGIGRINQPLCLIKLPFRLFELKGVYKSIRERAALNKSTNLHLTALSSTPTQQEKQLFNHNPFTQQSQTERYSVLDSAMDALTSLTVKRNLNTYNIQSTTGIVGKFGLSKHYYRLGEDILGTFDFAEASIKCFKYSVVLQIEETLSKNCLIDSSTSNLVHHLSLCRFEECCYMATKTNFLLHIPVTATPEFTHKIVSVRWRLHFEFTIEKVSESTKPIKTNEDEITLDQDTCVEKLSTETMLWDLPLHVVATNPIQASLMMQAESSDSIYL